MNQLRRLRRLVLGEAGPAPALVLVGVTLVIAVIVTVGPRALAAADTRATRQAVERAFALDTAVQVTAYLQAGPASGLHSATAFDALGRRFGAQLPRSAPFPSAQRWAGVILPSRQVLLATPPPQGRPQLVEAAYRSGLASHCDVVAGSLPTGSALIRPAAAGRPATITLQVALTLVASTTFRVHVGSILDLGKAGPGAPRVLFKVAGIVRPLSPASGFWQNDPELSAPLLEGPATNPHWLGAAFVGPGELPELAAAYNHELERVTWFFPLSSQLVAADVGRIETGVTALASGPVLRHAEVASGDPSLTNTTISTGLAAGLATFEAQWQRTAGTDSVLIVGLFAAGVALLLICCGLAARAYRPELALLRVRGGSLGQLARRSFARSFCIAAPALAAGCLLAIAVTPGGNVPVLLISLTALVAVSATPVICVLEHRKLASQSTSARADTGADAVRRRGSARRLVGELAVLLAAAAVLADLRLRGTAPQAGAGTTGPYLSASAVLVAAAVALPVGRVYRAPLRLLASAASIRRGAVGAIGLARAAAVRAGSVLPALTLMLGLTLTVFSAMVLTTVSTGQLAGSWERVGADAAISVSGTSSVSVGALRAIEQTVGVRHVAAVYVEPSSGGPSATLTAGRLSRPVVLAIVDPRPYAALAADTPWPTFPARSLARSASEPSQAVPMLVSPGISAQIALAGRQHGLSLEDYGQSIRVRIAGTITRTPVMPTGGDYILLPAWATRILTTVPSSSEALVTGQHLSADALRATSARVLPGSRIVFRRQVLAALNASPALQLSESLYVAGGVAAALVSALAVLFSLAMSARSRASMLTRLGALGMARSQSVLLGVTEAVPLLTVAAVGTGVCVWLLAVIVGPVLGLNTFTGTLEPAPLAPTWPDLVVPLGGAAVLSVAFLVIDGVLAARRKLAVALRQEETV
jgi:putative ABC transport system permease protein